MNSGALHVNPYLMTIQFLYANADIPFTGILGCDEQPTKRPEFHSGAESRKCTIELDRAPLRMSLISVKNNG
jgi:hypothetical protein